MTAAYQVPDIPYIHGEAFVALDPETGDEFDVIIESWDYTPACEGGDLGETFPAECDIRDLWIDGQPVSVYPNGPRPCRDVPAWLIEQAEQHLRDAS